MTRPPAGRILVVDDCPTRRMKLVKAVRQLGHGAEAVSDRAQARAKSGDGNVDFVLLNLEVPGMVGFAVLEAISASALLRDPPAIVAPRLDDIDSEVRALALGAVDYLPRTYDSVVVNVRINTRLQKNWQRDGELESLVSDDDVGRRCREGLVRSV